MLKVLGVIQSAFRVHSGCIQNVLEYFGFTFPFLNGLKELVGMS